MKELWLKHKGRMSYRPPIKLWESKLRFNLENSIREKNRKDRSLWGLLGDSVEHTSELCHLRGKEAEVFIYQLPSILGQRLIPGPSTPQRLYCPAAGLSSEKALGRRVLRACRRKPAELLKQCLPRRDEWLLPASHTLCDKVTSAPRGTKIPWPTLWRIDLKNGKFWRHPSGWFSFLLG